MEPPLTCSGASNLSLFYTYIHLQPQKKELKASLDAHGAELAKLQSKIDKVEDEVRAHGPIMYDVYMHSNGVRHACLHVFFL